MRTLVLTAVLCLLPVCAVAQLGLEPTLKRPETPTPTPQPSVKPAELNVTCPCYEVRQEPVYQDGRIARYQSVRKPSGTFEPRCCR